MLWTVNQKLHWSHSRFRRLGSKRDRNAPCSSPGKQMLHFQCKVFLWVFALVTHNCALSWKRTFQRELFKWGSYLVGVAVEFGVEQNINLLDSKPYLPLEPMDQPVNDRNNKYMALSNGYAIKITKEKFFACGF